MMTVSTLPWKMQFQNARQNEARAQVAAKSVVRPGTRSLGLAEQGRDQNRMIGLRRTISILDLVKEAEVAPVVREVEAGVAAEGGEVAAEEVEAARGLAKTSGCLRAVDPDFGGFRIAITCRKKIRASARAFAV